MPKKQYSDKRNKFLEENKRRVRLEIEARTKERLEQLDWGSLRSKRERTSQRILGLRKRPTTSCGRRVE